MSCVAGKCRFIQYFLASRDARPRRSRQAMDVVRLRDIAGPLTGRREMPGGFIPRFLRDVYQDLKYFVICRGKEYF